VREDTKAKRQALNIKINRLDKKLDNLHEAVLSGLFLADEAAEQKNKITEERHTLRSKLQILKAKWKTLSETQRFS